MNNIKKELKQTFTSYWQYLAMQTACELNIFDEIENGNDNVEKISLKTKTNKKILKTLLSALIDAKTIAENNNKFILTEKGEFLTDNHPETLKQACILWGKEHLTAWQNLKYTLNTDKPAFEYIYKSSFFDYIKKYPDKLRNYQLAMQEYARDDYKNITEIIDFSQFKTIADVGGSTGILIKNIAQKFPHKNCILTDLPEVINLIKSKPKNLTLIDESFFKPFSFKIDAVILSRILHDWNDKQAIGILTNCVNALNYKGKLFIIEIMQSKKKANLLTLNMKLMTGGFERTFNEYNLLLSKVNFEIKSKIQLNELQTILIASKK